jgi:hypothetical protein
MKTLLQSVEAAYDELTRVRVSSEEVMTKIPDHLKALVDEMRSLERQLRELYIAQAAKNMPVAVGGEGEPTLAESLDQPVPAHAIAVRAQAKLKARPLHSKYHPDKGGDPDKFRLVQKAVQNGDMEFIHMCLHREGLFTEVSLEELHGRLIAAISQARATPSFKLAQLYYSGSEERFASTYERLLMERINQLRLQTLGIS